MQTFYRWIIVLDKDVPDETNCADKNDEQGDNDDEITSER